jgi:tetratricopeptide (TPR) repeat protein
VAPTSRAEKRLAAQKPTKSLRVVVLVAILLAVALGIGRTVWKMMQSEPVPKVDESPKKSSVDSESAKESTVAEAPPPSSADALKLWQRHMDSGLEKLAKRDLDSAQADFTKARDVAPNDARKAKAVLERSRVNWERSDYVAARTDAEQLMALTKERDAEPFVLLAKVHCETWDFDQAIKVCERVPAGDARYPLAQAYRAIALAGNDQWDAVETVINRSISIWEKEPTGYRARGLAKFAHEHRNADALVLLDRAVLLDPNDSSIYVLRGRILASMRRYDEAIKDFETASQRTRSLEASVRRLDAMQAKVRNPLFKRSSISEEVSSGAIDAVLARRVPQSAAEWTQISALWRMKKDNAKADDALDKAINRQPRCIVALNAHGYFRMSHAKDYDAAAKDFHHVRQIAPANALAVYNLGDLANRKKNADEAMKLWLECERIDPRYVPPISARSTMHVERKEHAKAIDVCNSGLDVDRDHAIMLYNRAVSRAALKDIKNALLDFNRLAEMTPADIRAQLGGGKSQLDASLREVNSAIDFERMNPGFSTIEP